VNINSENKVYLLTDNCNYKVLKKCADFLKLPNLELISFPPSNEWGEMEEE
jgi:hypothetical protein